jgi:hypothetical protein
MVSKRGWRVLQIANETTPHVCWRDRIIYGGTRRQGIPACRQ